MNLKKVIGITGPCCAGKNYIAQILEQRSFPVLDVDKLGHEVIEEKKEILLARFGEDLLDPQGFIDRKKLGARVFGKPKELAALEGIIHPEVNRKTLEWINSRSEKACFINAALLHRSSAYEILDAIILVHAPLFVRMLRARKRDHLPWTAIIKRFWSQRKFRYQLLRKKTDIYRVGNSDCCTDSWRFGFKGLFRRNKPKERIDEILSLRGITRV